MASELLWYALYTNKLKLLGFIINQYERYIEKRCIYGKQCTISWYVNDNKLSHVEGKVNTRKNLESIQTLW